MARNSNSFPCRVAVALGLTLVLAGCTKGGQFDPTEIFNNDMFETKKQLKGDRQPMFPGGVPGATTGVPADLVKGYKPPPDADADAVTPNYVGGAPPPEQPKATAEAKPKPKPKPKPHVATTGAPAAQPTRINIGAKPGTPAQTSEPWPAPPQQNAQSQTEWPAPPQQNPQSQTAWPAPPPANQSQTAWPAPPPTGTARQ